jgi:type II secretory pathway pseudopilin PulG
MFKNSKGFSLVQVLVASGMMGGLTLVLLQFIKNTNDVQASTQAKSEEMELRTSIRMILDDERYCRVSIAGNGVSGFPTVPVTFKKQNVDDSATEGLDISLYYSNQTGDTRTLKKFNGANNPGTSDRSNFGKLIIKSIKLIMNNSVTPGPNYADKASHSDIGVLRAIVTRKTSMTTSRDSILDFDVIVGMATGQSPQTPGVTKLLSCTRKKDNEEKKDNYGYPSKCSIVFSHSDNGSPYRSTTLDMDSGGLVGLRMRGNVNNDDIFRFAPNCTSGGEEIDDYFHACTFSFGWKDVTDNANLVNTSPASSKSTLFGGTISQQLGGDVNYDDSFYYKMSCPNGSNSDLNTYVKKKCQICFAQGDQWRTSPANITCKKIQDPMDFSWGRVVVDGDVNADDAFFLGFFCEGEFSPIIKTITY